MQSNSIYPKKVLLGLQEGICNLKCPKCYTHGPNPISQNYRHTGFMKNEDLIKIIDEIEPFRPRVAPQTWDEPLLNPNILKQLQEIKKRNLPITMDTNGLLLNEKTMSAMIEMKLDSLFISLDALHASTYNDVRGVNKLAELTEKIELFLKIRNNEKYPRIGVSFVVETRNTEEKNLFVEKWSEITDVVRVNQQFMSGRKLLNKSNRARTSCWSLEDSLMIHFNGEAALCCVDTHYENKIGNVISDGVLNVWNGDFFNRIRKDHKKNNSEALPAICKTCDLWSHDEPTVIYSKNLMISETTSHTYYNRIDRLENILENRLAK